MNDGFNVSKVQYIIFLKYIDGVGPVDNRPQRAPPLCPTKNTYNCDT